VPEATTIVFKQASTVPLNDSSKVQSTLLSRVSILHRRA